MLFIYCDVLNCICHKWDEMAMKTNEEWGLRLVDILYIQTRTYGFGTYGLVLQNSKKNWSTILYRYILHKFQCKQLHDHKATRICTIQRWFEIAQDISELISQANCGHWGGCSAGGERSAGSAPVSSSLSKNTSSTCAHCETGVRGALYARQFSKTRRTSASHSPTCSYSRRSSFFSIAPKSAIGVQTIEFY